MLGLMGSTGRSTGSHLHFEVHRDGRTVDPFAYLGNRFTNFPDRDADPDATTTLRLSGNLDRTEPHLSSFAMRKAGLRQKDGSGE